MIIARLIVPFAVAVAVLDAGAAAAQGAFPAPLPGQSAAPAPAPANASPFPGPPSAPQSGAPSPFPSAGAAPLSGGAFGGGAPAPPTGGPSEACMKAYLPLRAEAEKRGKLLQAAGSKSTPEEACKLLNSYGAAEIKMMKYVEANAAKCSIPAQVGDQLKASHKNTEAMQQKVCGVAQQIAQQKAASVPSLSEVLGSAPMPEATQGKKGGSTFDTLNGNVLQR